MATMTHQRPWTRPHPVVLAVALSVLTAISWVVAALVAPDLEERSTVLTVSTVRGVLLLIAARGLWNGRRWGGIATLALTALSILMIVPALFQDDAAVLTLNLVELVACVIVIMALLRPAAWAFWNRGGAANSAHVP